MRFFTFILSGAAVLLASIAQSQSICFDPASDNRYQSSDSPREVGAGDFNEDGNLDVISVNNNGSADFFMGNGDGTFSLVDAGLETSGDELEVADMNNDGHLDIVRLEDNSGEVRINLGNGNGTFGVGITVVSGTTNNIYAEIALGDFDNNGFLDIAVNDPNDNQVHIIENSNGSVYAVATSITTGNTPSNVKAGDLNNDGFDDIVVAYSGLASVDFFINNNGVSYASQSYAVLNPGNADFSDIEMMDIDDDGDLDVIVNSVAVLEVFSNNGNGTSFTNLPDYFVGSVGYGTESGDWDEDGLLDLAVANTSGGVVNIRMNTGGSFTLPSSYVSTNANPVELCKGDFNNDGHWDLISANSNFGTITYLVGYGDGRFGSQSLLTGLLGNGVGSGDFDEDGDVDIVGVSGAQSVFSISLNNGDGTFADTEFLSVGFGTTHVVVADMNGDAHLDLISHSINGFLIWNGNGDGTFQEYLQVPLVSSGSGGDRTIVVRDFNGDGLMDMAGTFASQDELNICLASGVGVYAAPSVVATGAYPRYLSAGNINNDSYDDLIVTCNGANEVHVLLGSLSGAMSAPIVLTAGNSPEGATILDANEDGWNDVAIASPNSNDYQVYLSNNGTFGSSIDGNFPNGASATWMTHADANGDGHEDLIVGFYQTDNVGILFGYGDGLFAPTVTFDADKHPVVVITDDFNNDGNIDIGVANSGTNNISIILNNQAFITADGPVFFCEGGSVTLTATAGYSYEWSNGETTQSVLATEEGEYYCIIGNQAGTCDLLTSSIVVDVEQVVEVTWNFPIEPFCLNSEPYVLGGGQPTGGDYSGIGVNNGVFDPAAAGVGIHPLTYVYDSNASCFEGSTVLEVEVVEELNVTLELIDDSPCLGVSYTLAGGAPAGGDYYFNSTLNDVINTSEWGPGEYEVMYIFNQSQNCSGSAVQTLTIESCVGVDEINDAEFIVYPTQATNEVYIKGGQLKHVRLIDMTGRVVVDSINPSVNTIDLSRISAGMYVVEINDSIQVKIQKL